MQKLVLDSGSVSPHFSETTLFAVVHELVFPVRILYLANDGAAAAFRARTFRIVGQPPLRSLPFNLQEPVVRQSRVVLTVIVVPGDSFAVEWC